MVTFAVQSLKPVKHQTKLLVILYLSLKLSVKFIQLHCFKLTKPSHKKRTPDKFSIAYCLAHKQQLAQRMKQQLSFLLLYYLIISL